MSKPMTLQEFANVVSHINQHNAPRVNRRKADGTMLPCVKYMDPVFDFRFPNVFSVKFRGYGSEIQFHCQNECRDLPDSLYTRVMKYLKGE